MIKKIFNFQFSIFNSSRGFTVLESLVAILILSISISVAFSIVQQSVSQNSQAMNEIKAFYLAQEAIEIIRNKRDSNQLAKINGGAGNWLDGLCPVGNICAVDATDFSVFDCGSGIWGKCGNRYLRQDPVTFSYGYNAGWTQTNFKREIKIESINADEIAVTVRISWTRGITKYFDARTHLFNWGI